MAAPDRDPRAPALKARLGEILAARLPGCAVALGEVRRIGPASAVIFADIDAQPVVAKLYTGADAADTLRAQAAELAAVTPHMSSGPYRVNPLLHSFPDAGLAVLGRVPGAPFGDALQAATPARRAALITEAGRWLKCYQAPRRRAARFGSRYWLDRAEGLDRAHLFGADAQLAVKLLERMRALEPAARGATVTQAATHGDFVSFNLMFDGNTLYGFDIQGTAWQAVATEVARFLVWEAIHTAPTGGPRRWGLEAGDLAAMRASGVLEPEAFEAVLPLLIGYQLLFRFTENAHRRRLANNARIALEDYAKSPGPGR